MPVANSPPAKSIRRPGVDRHGGRPGASGYGDWRPPCLATPLQLLLFVVGLLTLAAGAEALIRGAVRVARALGISPFITARPEGEEIGRRAAALEHLNREHSFSNGTNGRHRRPCPEEMPC